MSLRETSMKMKTIMHVYDKTRVRNKYANYTETLILKGLPDVPNETPSETKRRATQALAATLKSSRDIVWANRMGPPIPGRTRPVLVMPRTWLMRHRIYRRGKNALHGTGMAVYGMTSPRVHRIRKFRAALWAFRKRRLHHGVLPPARFGFKGGSNIASVPERAEERAALVLAREAKREEPGERLVAALRKRVEELKLEAEEGRS